MILWVIIINYKFNTNFKNSGLLKIYNIVSKIFTYVILTLNIILVISYLIGKFIVLLVMLFKFLFL